MLYARPNGEHTVGLWAASPPRLSSAGNGLGAVSEFPPRSVKTDPTPSPALDLRRLIKYADGMPPGSLFVVRSAYDEVHGLGERVVPFRGDPRYPLLYKSPLFLSLCRWAAARTLLQKAMAADVPTDGSDALLPTPAMADAFEAHFSRLLNEALDGYWKTAYWVVETGTQPLFIPWRASFWCCRSPWPC